MTNYISDYAESVKVACQLAKYLGIAATTGLSIHSLYRDTVVRSTDPKVPNSFTRAGRTYLVGLLSLTIFTIIVSILENKADRALNLKAAEQAKANLSATSKKILDEVLPPLQQQQGELKKGFDSAAKNLLEVGASVGASIASAQILARVTAMPLSNFKVALKSAAFVQFREPTLFAGFHKELENLRDSSCLSQTDEFDLVGHRTEQEQQEYVKCMQLTGQLDTLDAYRHLASSLDKFDHVEPELIFWLYNNRLSVFPMHCDRTPTVKSPECPWVYLHSSRGGGTILNAELHLEGERIEMGEGGMSKYFRSEPPPMGREFLPRFVELRGCDNNDEPEADKKVHLQSFARAPLEMLLTFYDKSEQWTLVVYRLKLSHREQMKKCVILDFAPIPSEY